MRLDFLPESSAELYQAAEYYESKQEGLGWRFRNEAMEVCQMIVQHSRSCGGKGLAAIAE
jgi:hypothetical protein